MALVREQFEIPARMRTWAFGLMAVGLLAVIGGFIVYGLSSNNEDKAVFWGTLLYNSMYFTMICNAVMFFICATTLAMA
ncbi:MAG: quinol:cytochrome C oxidoreductase, partial [Bacteroidota bacterium]|nr:quinol:cytochrome C oxidoreductase [Bacteroidota bacterium]